MAPSLRPVAQRVLERAHLRRNDRVLDVGTGTGTAAGLARGDGRRIVGLDAAPGMLAIARAEVAGVEFVEASFDAIPFPDGAFDVVIAVHALLFADDRVAALLEWRRACAPGGRLSLSVPGPGDRVPMSIFGPIFDRYGIDWGIDYPTLADVAGWADAAGWSRIETDADPSTAVVLPDASAFRTWLTVGARGRATAEWSDERREAFAGDLMAVTPRDDRGTYLIPFGTLYLVARRP